MKNITVLAKSIRTALLLGAVSSTTAFAVTEQEVERDVDQLSSEVQVEQVEEESEVERIEITGSRIKTIDLEGPSPITVIGAEEMSAKGFQTAYDALKDLTANTGVTQGAEMAAQGGFTPNAQTVSLRGLGNNQVLVLVNGRRMADYPSPYNGQSNFVNLSQIPAVAIARIEIMTSGASAVYGSDAVAGVMNIITKKDIEETTISIKGGTTTEGGGEEGRFQIVSGVTGNDYNITGAIEYQVQKKILAADRDWMDSVDDGPAGHQFLDRGIVEVDLLSPYTYFYEGDDKYEDEDGNFIAPPRYISPGLNACNDSETGYILTERYTEQDTDDEYYWGEYCGTDNTGTRTIRNDRETATAYISGNYEFNDDIQMFGDVIYSYQDAEFRSGFHYINEDMLIKVDDPDDSNLDKLIDSNPTLFEPLREYKWVAQQRMFSENEVGFKDGSIEDTALIVNFGFKGVVLEDYDWDLTFSRSQNDSESRSKQLKEEKVHKYFLGGYRTIDLGDAIFQGYEGSGMDLYRPLSQDVLSDFVGEQWQESDSYSNSVTAVISGPAWEMEAGDAYFALVAEWNKQGYDIELDDRTLNRDEYDPSNPEAQLGWHNLTGTMGGGDRSRYAVGFELQIPWLDNLNTTLAGRYDQYEDGTTDIGGRFTPQVGVAYYPTDNMLLRANWGKSFKAPDMHRVFAEDGGYFTGGVDLVNCEKTYYENLKDDDGEFPDDLDSGEDKFDLDNATCAGSVIEGTSNGSKTLKEEEGTSYGVGMVWNLTDDFDVTIDWYSIEIEQLVISESVGRILEYEFYCLDRSQYSEDYPEWAQPTERDDIEPGSKFCADNQDKISRADEEDVFGNIPLDSVHTTAVNAAKQTREGVDAKVNYRLDSEHGDFYFKLAWSHILDSSAQIDEESKEIHTRDLWYNYAARSVMNGSVTWMQENYSLTLSGRRIGSIPIMNPPAEFGDEDSYYFEKVQRLEPYYTFNLTGTYAVDESLILSAQVVNLFNPRPPKDETATRWPFYNSMSYGGASVGRVVSAEMIYTF